MVKARFGGWKPGLLSVAYQSRLGRVSSPPAARAATQPSTAKMGTALERVGSGVAAISHLLDRGTGRDSSNKVIREKEARPCAPQHAICLRARGMAPSD